jgi:hypothetical protein
MTLQEQIKFLKEQEWETRLAAQYETAERREELIKKANALTFIHCSLRKLHELREAFRSALG